MKAIKALQTLIRLHKRDLDLKRKELLQLEEQKAKLEEGLATLQAEYLREQEVVTAKPELMFSFLVYAERNKEQQARMKGIIANTKIQIDRAQEAIEVLYGEIKKYEIALENKLEELRREEARKETIELDEIAQGQFQRRRNDAEE